MPKAEDIFSQLNEAKYFSILDLQAGYHPIPLDELSIPKTAFTTQFGKYKYIKVPFGLIQAPAYFQELMTSILKGISPFLSLIWMTSLFSADEHLNHIKQVFEKLRNAHLLVKLSKCHYFTKEIQYIRHILNIKGIRPLPSKTQSINNMYPPKTAKQVCTFLGLIGYYRKFIKNLSTLLTHQKAKSEWTPAHHTAFLSLEESVTHSL